MPELSSVLTLAFVVLLAVLMEVSFTRAGGWRLAWLEARWKLQNWRENAALFCAHLLPRWLVLAAGIRLVAYATVGRYGDTVVPELTAITALQRWEESND